MNKIKYLCVAIIIIVIVLTVCVKFSGSDNNIVFEIKNNIATQYHPYNDNIKIEAEIDYSVDTYEKIKDKKENRPWEIFYEDQIKYSSACYVLLLKQKEISKESSKWIFEVIETVYGETPKENTVTFIYESQNAYYTAFKYEEGKEYLVTVDNHKYSNLYGIERYFFEGGMYINLTDMKDFQWIGGNIKIDDNLKREDFIRYIKSFSEKYGYKDVS